MAIFDHRLVRAHPARNKSVNGFGIAPSGIVLRTTGLIFLVATSLPASSQQTGFRIRVIDDSNRPVSAVIWKIGQQKDEKRLGPTDNNGYLNTEEHCNQGERVQARPATITIHYNKTIECPLQKANINMLVVTSKQLLETLAANAVFLLEQQKFADASLVFNDIAARAADFNPKIASLATVKSYELFGKVLNVSEPLSPSSTPSAPLMSPQLKAAIEKFQLRNSVYRNNKTTGILDYATLSKKSGAEISDYLFNCKNQTGCSQGIERFATNIQ